jgi:rhamnulokinase
MVKAIQDYCRRTAQPVPETTEEVCRCIFDSLALRYKQVFGYLKEMAPFPLETLHIIGGGTQNVLLNQLTANATGVTVVTGPIECTAIGNIMLQAKAAGLVSDIRSMRALIAASIETKTYTPQDANLWEEAFKQYLSVCKEKE